MIILTGITLVFTFIIILALIIIKGQDKEIIKLNYILDNRKDKQKRDFKVIENLGGIIESQEVEITKKDELINYRNKRIEELEDLLVIADGNKKHKSGRKLTK